MRAMIDENSTRITGGYEYWELAARSSSRGDDEEMFSEAGGELCRCQQVAPFLEELAKISELRYVGNLEKLIANADAEEC